MLGLEFDGWKLVREDFRRRRGGHRVWHRLKGRCVRWGVLEENVGDCGHSGGVFEESETEMRRRYERALNAIDGGTWGAMVEEMA